MSAAQPSKQPQGLVPQVQKKDEMENVHSSSSRPPFDPFPWIYWLIFILVVPVVAFWMTHKLVPPPPQVSLPYLHQNTLAYHVITQGDVYTKLVDKSSITTDTVHRIDDLIGHYTLTPLSADQPIHQSQIGPKPDPSLIANTLAVGIPSDNAMILGGNLHAGDVVSIATVPLSSPTSSPTIVFDKVLVLDVKPAGSQSLIILAIPTDHWLDYLAKMRNATVVLALL